MILISIHGSEEKQSQIPLRRMQACSKRRIPCGKCSKWYHKDCIHMGDPIFDSYTLNESLEWECTHCALSNISSSIFNSTVSNDTSADKPKSLRVSVCNFQSIWNKRAILSTFLSENDIDVLIGSETHLTKDILNSEISPSNYIATRKDRDDNISRLCKKYKNKPISVAGDFSLPDIDRTTNTTTGNQYSHDLNRLFLELFEPTKLCQCVNFNTRKNST